MLLLTLLGGGLQASPSVAFVGHFTAPVRLPTRGVEWRFAVNDRGQAVGAYGTQAGVVVARLARSGRIEHSWTVGVPAHVGGVYATIALDDRGEVAVAVEYADGQSEGCCGHIGVAAWRLGKRPPEARAVSPALTPADFSDQPVEPSVVVANGMVTAVWHRGGKPISQYEEDEREPGQVEEAFGRLGGPFHTVRLVDAREGPSLLNLHVAPDGRPVASWLQDRDVVGVASGRPAGGFRPAVRLRRVRKLREGVGFAHDGAGDTLFAYLSGPKGTAQGLMVMAITASGRFVRPRRIMSVPLYGSGVEVYAGGLRSVLVTWQGEGFTRRTLIYARRGSVFGRFGRRLIVDDGAEHLIETVGLIDSHRRSLMINRGDVAHHPNQFDLVAFTARPGRPFSRARRIAPRLHNCGLEGSGELDLKPIASSPNGEAVFYLTCEEGSGQEGSQYLIRYMP
ncbi:MAG: hypothetical protein ACYCYN_07325 [Solirubrobacteraceae bacterium]